MDEEIRSSTTNDDDSNDHRRRQQYRLNARHRLSNLPAEERSRWLARRNECQRERRRARQHQLSGRAEIERQIQLQRQTSELETQHVRHRDAVVTRARSTNAGPSHRVVAWEQPINNIGAGIPRGARLSSIKRLARDQCSTTAETFGQQSVNGVGQFVTNAVRLSSIRRLARNHRSPTAEIVGIPNNEDEPSHIYTSANIPIEQAGEFEFVEEIEFANDNEVVDAPAQRRRRTTFRYHNCARNFRDYSGFHTFSLPPLTVCCHCQAKLFFRESRDFCCQNGKTILPHIPSPPELLLLFNDRTGKGKHFRHNIRAYNHLFAFTSMGVHVDEGLANGKDGVYSFRAQGAIYHKIGSLLPTLGNRPRFIQLYIYDTDHEVDRRMAQNNSLHRDIVEELKNILDATNPFVHQLRQLGQRQDIENCRLHIKEQAKNQPQYTLPSASQVAAIIVEGGQNELINGRDIVVQTTGGDLLRIAETAGYYDPLQYPLLLPYGSYGWDRHSRDSNIRDDDVSLLLRGGRLFQQYVVDNFVKIDADRLRWLKYNQPAIRAEMYQGLQDALAAGENDSGTIGMRTILPSSYIGGPRDMYQRYQDAMALVQKYGKPDLFITMTCNPGWPEITNALKPGQTPSNRPDLTTRVFRCR